MVEKVLVEKLISAGELLTRRLEGAKFPLVASLWLYNEDSGRWRLLLSSPMVDEKGELRAYERVQEALRSNPDLKLLSLDDISVVSSKDPLVKDLRLVLGSAADVRGVRLGGTRVNDHLVDGAYLYRLSPVKRHRASRVKPTGGERRSRHKSRAISG